MLVFKVLLPSSDLLVKYAQRARERERERERRQTQIHLTAVRKEEEKKANIFMREEEQAEFTVKLDG